MDIHALTTLADYFVICSGRSDRQLKAIAEGVEEHAARNLGVKPRHVEGDAASGWVLIDFTPTRRSFYNLEGLWRDAPVLLRMQ
jgi:ribosome-associated protein